MTSQPNTSELAKQGNPHAIAALINHSLKSKGITAKASLKGECLRVMLESINVPSQPAMVHFIHQGMTKLKVESIQKVKIYGRQAGQDFPSWTQELDLRGEPTLGSHNSPETQAGKTHLLKEAQLSDFSNSLLAAPGETQKTGSSVGVSHNDSNTKVAALPRRINQVLISSLGVRIGIDSLFVMYSIVWATSYYIYNLLDVTDATGFIADLIHALVIAINALWYPLETITVWIYRLTVVITLLWLYRFHVNLRTIFSGYPIKPWGAVRRLIIPVYSFWGIWNIFSTLANRFKSKKQEVANFAVSISRWLPWFYVSMISSNVLNQVYRFQYRNASEPDFSPWLFVFKNSADLLFTIAWLQLVRFSNKAIFPYCVDKPTTDSSKLNSIKAVGYGLLFNIIGALVIDFTIKFIVGFMAIVTGNLLEPITTIFYSYPSGVIVGIIIGLLFTIMGGFITANFAPKYALKHTFIMGTLSVFLGLMMAGFQVSNRYHAIAILLGIPAALLGGYLQRITRNFRVGNAMKTVA